MKPEIQAQNEQRKAHRNAWVREQRALADEGEPHGCLNCYGHGHLYERIIEGDRFRARRVPCSGCQGTGRVT